jgi:ribose transport system permease protein
MRTLTARLFVMEWSGLVFAIALGALTLAMSSPAFLTEFNIYVALRSLCVPLLVAYAQMVVLSVGQINLSVGALGGLVAIAFGGMMEVLGLPAIIAAPLALAIGALCGWVNGFLTVKTGISGFIITLATGSAFAGVNLGVTKAIPFYHMPAGVTAFGTARVSVFPFLIVVPALATAILALLFARAVVGRQMLAVGGNAHAAALSGIATGRTIILAHMLSGALAATAAILAVAQLGSAQPTIGADWLLISFAAPIIGGAGLAGGHVSVVGALLAVLLIALIENGMVLVSVDQYWMQFVLGALIVAAVSLNRWRAVATGAD